MLKIKVTSSEFRRFPLHAAGQKTAYIIIVPDFGAIVNTENEKSTGHIKKVGAYILCTDHWLMSVGRGLAPAAFPPSVILSGAKIPIRHP
ncbi:MAG: hypothetical protein IKB28_02480 [Clostridia bacterium]|nr:hypothetical protein [Oscillospiraceae bacterium]MBR2445513.1 hypothetical protein [Clostridia bacterium]